MREIHFVGGVRGGDCVAEDGASSGTIGVPDLDDFLDPEDGEYQDVTLEVITYKRVWTGPCGREIFVPEDWL
jgi:hypothetical protein